MVTGAVASGRYNEASSCIIDDPRPPWCGIVSLQLRAGGGALLRAMAKLLLVCHRDRSSRLDRTLFHALSRAIIPDNIVPPPARVLTAPGLDVGVFNPSGAVHVQGTSACLGHLIDPGDDWGRVGAARPDGSYALFRADDRSVELISDACASRTIWYVLTDDLFVASTSQRAIVAVLGSYHPNRQAMAWMLSAGNLGPGQSWDSRIKCLGGNASLTLEREGWTLRLAQDRIEFIPRRAPDHVHREQLTRALREAVGGLQIDRTTWYLLLSGGFDSRCILLMLQDRSGLRSITWGLASALDIPKSDAVVAQELAGHFGLQHIYYSTDIAAQAIGTVFERLLVAGEGRTDTVSAYMDGCDIWRRLSAAGIAGVIRGDIVFSPYRVYSDLDVRRVDGAMFMQDYDNLARMSGWFGAEQYWPQHLHRRAGESLSTWRDRLTYEYRCPVIWAALNEIKSSYVEVMNPLLARRVLETIVTLPDHLRDGRSLYTGIVNQLSPPIAFAEHNAIEHTAGILSSAPVVSHLVAALDTAAARNLLSDELVSLVLGNIRTAAGERAAPRRPLPKFLRRWLPERLRMYKNRALQPRDLDINVLALRAYIILAMHERLTADAAMFSA